ncbi:MAG: quinone-dependent dihydroorotate dehydrogenase [Patescibacteria group bacterium]
MQSFISRFSAQAYQQLLKPVFFSFDAETVHEFMLNNGEFFGKISPLQAVFSTTFAFRDPALEQTIKGIRFTNPVGLAAGFDYNAQLTQILGDVGFGFQTVGTITAEPFGGNPKPRLGRLPKSRSLLVNKGYKNPGIDEVVEKLQAKQFPIPVGLSVGSTNREYKNDKEQIENFLITFQKVEKNLPRITHYELNISCPNLRTGEPFNTPAKLTALLKEVEKLKFKKPVFIKMPTDITVAESNALLKAADKFTIAGAVIGNLTKDRKNPDLDPEEVAAAGQGNFSGKPTEKRTNNLLQGAYKEFHKRYVFIGCGGVFNAEDAYRKIKLGASLIQIITGMIYEGPQLIGQINQGLVELLHEDGFEHIAEAIGTGNKK